MNPLPDIHLTIVQPAGYLHWMAMLDQVRYYRYQFSRLGARVTMAKNRLRHDAINFVFGAHLGFDPGLRDSHTCIFVNLEQFGPGAPVLDDAYLQLLRTSAVIDYDRGNPEHYTAHAVDVPVAPMLNAPYLAPAVPVPLEERPIDLLFIGSMNDRRARWLSRVEAAGWNISAFNSPLYGEERDEVIRNAKAVINVHFYDACRLEQSRVAHCLSLGTPVISERDPRLVPHEAFEDSVLWLPDDEVDGFFRDGFATPAYFDAVRTGLARFAAADPIADYAEVLNFASGYAQVHAGHRRIGPWQPTKINLGSGKDYQSGWLNLDVVARTEPDLLLDLAQPLTLPAVLPSTTLGPVALEEGGIDLINASNVLEHVADLPALMTNCMRLLKVGGEMLIEVPCEGAPTAWQDPTHLRAMNENSWLYYTDWFWYLGWYEYRFELISSAYADLSLKPCRREAAAFIQVLLRKVETTPQERTVAQAMQPGIRLPDDPAPLWQRPSAMPAAAAVASRTAQPSVIATPVAAPAAMPAMPAPLVAPAVAVSPAATAMRPMLAMRRPLQPSATAAVTPAAGVSSAPATPTASAGGPAPEPRMPSGMAESLRRLAQAAPAGE